jgi:hypothetical protein
MFSILNHKGNASQNNIAIYLTLVTVAITKNTNNNKCWRGCGGKEPLYAVSAATMEISMDIPQNIKNTNAHDSAIPEHIPKECKLAFNRDTCTPMFIAAHFTIAKL